MPRISEITGVDFDGVNNPYVPPRELRISPKLKLHADWDRDIDPVTYEVVRHNLWQINEEHGATIQRLSGSPVAMYALDLNPSLLTEDAEFVYFGPYMQYMSGVTDTQVKWTLENRSDNPGIRDGDMFLANDPWVGAAHQQDVMLLCPVFWEGELFCWVTNCLHQYDIGGITPGSFCPSAESAYDEGIMLPPIKIIEGGEIRRDIEAVYLRASRKPQLVALDFRAQMAGNTTARNRVLELIERYGPKTVKGVMKRIIDNSEKSFLEKMKRLPDGYWQDRTYIEACRPGDRRTHRVQLQLRKDGEKLVFTNDGTADQEGAMNATYSGWRGAIMVAVTELLCWDQYFAVGGALRHIEFDPTPGTLNCANFPASVSTAPIQSMEISLYPAYNVLSKMIYPDGEMRKDIMCIGGTSQWPATLFRGIDQWGERYGYLLVDPIGGAIGAFSHADGINTGGQSRTPICQLPNVEHTEQSFPILFLYRKELPDSGGAGKYRGGLSAESCFIPHNTTHIVQDTLSSGNATPTSSGMMGGYPSTTNAYVFLRDTDILERNGRSQMIEDVTEVSGREELLQLRQENFVQNGADVYAVRWTGGGGFGDPFDRLPEDIDADLEAFAVTPEAAVGIYGAVLDANDRVDAAATTRRRAELRAAFVAKHGAQGRVREGRLLCEASVNLHVKRDAAGSYWACAKCSADLGATTANYKDACLREDLPVSASNPLIGDPARFIDDEVSFRRFHCPCCGAQIDNEIAVSRDPILADIHVAA
ncbi:MAG: hydantoinase B/oxoprolinase family protein [Gammaproteobacteria bacterium]|nr:hydantoinase B/oxoprolinase family protein [Gammaproteobacteria bacterium]